MTGNTRKRSQKHKGLPAWQSLAGGKVLVGERAARSLGPDTRTLGASYAHYKANAAQLQPTCLCSVGLGLCKPRFSRHPAPCSIPPAGGTRRRGEGSWSRLVSFLSLAVSSSPSGGFSPPLQLLVPLPTTEPRQAGTPPLHPGPPSSLLSPSPPSLRSSGVPSWPFTVPLKSLCGTPPCGLSSPAWALIRQSKASD